MKLVQVAGGTTYSVSLQIPEYGAYRRIPFHIQIFADSLKKMRQLPQYIPPRDGGMQVLQSSLIAEKQAAEKAKVSKENNGLLGLKDCGKLLGFNAFLLYFYI